MDALRTLAPALALLEGFVAVEPDTVFPLYSATKPLVATCLLAAVEEGKLELDDPAARFLPGFERHGKGAITVRHLLTHTAGIPVSPGPDLHDFATSAAYAATLLDVVPYAAPGTRALPRTDRVCAAR